MEEDVEAEENIRQLAAAAGMNGAVSRGSSNGGGGRGRSTSFHVDSDSGSDSDGSSGSGSGSSSSSTAKKKVQKKSNRQVSKKTRDILECKKLKEDTRKQPLSAADKAEQKLRDDIGRGTQRSSPGKKRVGKNKQKKQPYDALVKILLLGDSGVGKTCLLTRFSEKKYSPSLVTTAGIDFQVQYFEVKGIKVKCQIWDTAGQERFHVITKAFYKGAHGIALVYDVTDRKTLENIDYWLGNISDNASAEVESVLIANKVDLPRAINQEEGETVAAARKIRYLETSAKTGTNVKEGEQFFQTKSSDFVIKISRLFFFSFVLFSFQHFTI